MATKTAENVAAVQVFGTLAGQQVMNDFYFQFDEQPTHIQLVNLAEAVSATIIEVWPNHLSGAWEGRSVFAFDMTVESGENAVNDSIAGFLGIAPGTPRANNETLAVARKNGLRGRSGNGRIFWPGLTQGMCDTPNTVSAVYAAAFVVDCKAIDAAALDVGGTGVILSFQHNGIVSDAATVYPIDNWITTDRVVDSRRRRLPGRGV